MTRPSRSKKTPAFKAGEKKRVRTVWGSALGAAVGSLAGGALTHNPELVGQMGLAIQLSFEGAGRTKERADVIHCISNIAKSCSPPNGRLVQLIEELIEDIKAGKHVGTAEPPTITYNINDILSKMNPIPQNEWPPAPAAPPKPKKGRKS